MPNDPDILPGLHDVPWASLRTAHGTAESIPAAIRGLASATSDADADHWYWKLDNHVVLQGSLYEAAYAVIPFAISIVDSSAPEFTRAHAYDLLVEIARGVVGDPSHASVVAPSGATEPLDRACLEQIVTARDRYVADLQGDESTVRRKALDLIVSLDDDPASVRKLLVSIDPAGDDEFADALNRELDDLD
ncbi:MAG TPA: hypothetical protein VFP34_00920 [Microlunatus sp.]|jgi:hypothetical protein|nr:hypothetical protein [Microlunatus sp.]